MTKSLQSTLSDSEYEDIRMAAHAREMSVTGWVREALTATLRRASSGEIERKLEAIRLGARHEGPTGNIEAVLSDIERGYLGGEES
ncbi:MAG: hypothetical protein ACRD51_12080 [Candidatus Acidiferrum sp.]